MSWHKSNRTWSENHAIRLLASMNNHIFPVIGHLPVAELKPRHFIDQLKGIEQKGLLEVAARICPGLLQLHRNFLSLFISMANKAEAFLTGHCRFATDVPAFQVPIFVVVQM